METFPNSAIMVGCEPENAIFSYLLDVDYIAADFDDLAAAEAALGSVLADLQETLSALDNDLYASLAQWTGAAADAYWAAHDRWWRGADEMAGRLAGLRKVITTARCNYLSSVAANTRMWDAT